MNNNLIINIGRQIGSGGRIIAKLLADDFGCTFFDKELLNLAAKESGFSEKFFEENDERKGFFKSRFNFQLPILNDHVMYRNAFSQENLYKFQCDAIRKAAQQGNCVFVGRTADYVLRDEPYKFDIFITANLEDRIATVAEREHLSKEDAVKFIEKKEDARASYYNYYTGKKWGHSSSYDLCVNSSFLGLEATEKLIYEFIKQRLEKMQYHSKQE